MENKRHIIYSLNNPTTNEIFYVGKTTQLLKNRLSSHLIDKTNVKKHELIKSLIKDGLMPTINKLQSCNKKNSSEIEYKWISKFISEGHTLLNKSYHKQSRICSPRYDNNKQLMERIYKVKLKYDLKQYLSVYEYYFGKQNKEQKLKLNQVWNFRSFDLKITENFELMVDKNDNKNPNN